ncbi:hypothetical protein SAMN02910447_02823 [Ruminococcus sp. YE71]|uniref:hypothetical protein n=1 Tax=unclassified Ruminococcus TaxID=2608920 RepID=UPI0008914154|nr:MULTISPECIES: hypothetical protein [unclassified Ruminococcus]SDA27112.1 hypothetical protein SAMN02910446_02728 [Ruminococcus sp. YE78]SFW45531.1 hypothetical protein SAMN02910447_02823 [Ruminococcus sp. YE71]
MKIVPKAAAGLIGVALAAAAAATVIVSAATDFWVNGYHIEGFLEYNEDGSWATIDGVPADEWVEAHCTIDPTGQYVAIFVIDGEGRIFVAQNKKYCETVNLSEQDEESLDDSPASDDSESSSTPDVSSSSSKSDTSSSSISDSYVESYTVDYSSAPDTSSVSPADSSSAAGSTSSTGTASSTSPAAASSASASSSKSDKSKDDNPKTGGLVGMTVGGMTLLAFAVLTVAKKSK